MAGQDPISNSGTESSGRAGRYAIALLLVVYASNFIDRTITSVVAEPMKHDLGLQDWQLGLLGGLAFALFYTTLGIPIARLAERRNRVTIISGCLAVWSVMTALCGLSQTFPQLLLARIGVGVGEAGCTPAAQSLISDRFPPEKRAVALSVFVLGVPIGTLVGAVLGGWIAQHIGWRAAFMIVGLPGLGLTAIVWLTLREPTRGAFDPVVAEPRSPAPSLSTVLKTMWGRRVMRHLLAGACLSAFGSYGVHAFAIPFFIRSFHVSLVQASSAFGIGGAGTSMFGILFGGWLAGRLGARDRRYLALVPALGLFVAGSLDVAAFLQMQLAPLAALLIGAAAVQGFNVGPTYAIINNEFDQRSRATAVAILMFAMNLVGLGFGPLAVGALSDLIAANTYGAGFAANCAGTAAFAATACKAASATGLRDALCIVSLTILWAAFHYWRAAAALTAETRHRLGVEALATAM